MTTENTPTREQIIELVATIPIEVVRSFGGDFLDPLEGRDPTTDEGWRELAVDLLTDGCVDPESGCPGTLDAMREHFEELARIETIVAAMRGRVATPVCLMARSEVTDEIVFRVVEPLDGSKAHDLDAAKAAVGELGAVLEALPPETREALGDVQIAYPTPVRRPTMADLAAAAPALLAAGDERDAIAKREPEVISKREGLEDLRRERDRAERRVRDLEHTRSRCGVLCPLPCELDRDHVGDHRC